MPICSNTIFEAMNKKRIAIIGVLLSFSFGLNAQNTHFGLREIGLFMQQKLYSSLEGVHGSFLQGRINAYSNDSFTHKVMPLTFQTMYPGTISEFDSTESKWESILQGFSYLYQFKKNAQAGSYTMSLIGLGLLSFSDKAEYDEMYVVKWSELVKVMPEDRLRTIEEFGNIALQGQYGRYGDGIGKANLLNYLENQMVGYRFTSREAEEYAELLFEPLLPAFISYHVLEEKSVIPYTDAETTKIAPRDSFSNLLSNKEKIVVSDPDDPFNWKEETFLVFPHFFDFYAVNMRRADGKVVLGLFAPEKEVGESPDFWLLWNDLAKVAPDRDVYWLNLFFEQL